MADVLTELLSSKVRAAVLAHILPRPHLGFSLTDLSRALALPISSVQHECYKLERLGLLAARRDGATRRYRVTVGCPLRAPLTALVLAAIGVEAALRGAVDGSPGLEHAFLAGERSLVAVGDVPLDVLDGIVARVEQTLGTTPGTIELAFFRSHEWRDHVAAGDAYVTELLARPRIELTGESKPAASAQGPGDLS